MPATQPKAASKDLAKNVKEARVAARAMAALSAADREKALSAMRAALEQQRDVIEKANAIDIENAKKNSLSDALQGRLNVSGKKFDGMLSKVDEVKAVPDPLGVVSRKTELDKGLELSRVACPIGVICVIFESRPEAAVQIASLTIRSGNAVILKGGKEAANTNAALVHAMQCGLTASGVMPASAVQLVQSRVLAKRAAEKASNEDGKWSRHRMSVGTSNFAKELSLAAAAQAKVDAINKLEVEGDKNDPSFKDEGSFVSKSFTNKELDDLVARENEMRVENYEFSSPHAISREYMENHHDVVSVL